MKHINSQKGSVTQIVVIIAIVVIAGIWLAVSKKGTDAPVTASSSPITLLTPNGGETLAIGATTTVSFKTEGEIKDNYRVVIWLDEGAAPLATIAATTTSHVITIPSTVLIGGDAAAPLTPGSYKIRVSLHDGEPCTGLCPAPVAAELGSDMSDGTITIVSSTGAQATTSPAITN